MNENKTSSLKVVILDYDETLVQTLKARFGAYQEVGHSYGLEITEEKFRKNFGIPYREFIKLLFDNVDTIENIVIRFKRVTDKYPNIVYPGAMEFVNTLLSCFEVGILTGFRREILLNEMKSLKFPVDRFFCIQTDEDTTSHKPDPKVFVPILEILKSQSIKPSEAIYIGDDFRDFEAANGAGLRFCGIYGRTTTKEKFDAAGAVAFGSYEEIMKYFGI